MPDTAGNSSRRRRRPTPVVVPAPVIVEVCQLLDSRRGTRSEAAFLTSLGAGELDVIDLKPADYIRTAQLVTQYADLPLGAVDACVIAIAERLRATEIATLDRRHFGVVRPAPRPRVHVAACALLTARPAPVGGSVNREDVPRRTCSRHTASPAAKPPETASIDQRGHLS